jgi:MFS family permease
MSEATKTPDQAATAEFVPAPGRAAAGNGAAPADAAAHSVATDTGAADSGEATSRGDSILRNRDFVKLWAGESVSLVGTQVSQFALPLVAILTLQATVFQVGLLNACRYAPVVLVSLFAGVWLDHHRRRPILIACSLGNALLIGLVPLSYAGGVLSITLLYVVCICVGVLTAVFDIGVLSYVPWLVERRHLADSNSKIQTSTALAGIAGPGLAGFLVGLVTAPVALAVNSVSYLCSALGLATIQKHEEEPATGQDRPSIKDSVIEGLRAVYGNPLLRGLLTQSATFNFFQNAMITVFVVYAIRSLGLTPAKLGIVIGAISVGGVLGAMYANRVRLAIGFGRTMMFTTVIGPLCPLLLLVPRGAGLGSMAILAGTQAFYGFNLLVFNVNTLTLRQRITPNRLLGRMNASYRMVLFGLGPIGAILGGLLGQVAGVGTAMVITALLLTTPALWVLFSPVFRLRDMPPDVLPDAMDVTAAARDKDKRS